MFQPQYPQYQRTNLAPMQNQKLNLETRTFTILRTYISCIELITFALSTVLRSAIKLIIKNEQN
jgi:hypothetical protein